MCQSSKAGDVHPKRSSSLLLLTHNSFLINEPDKDDENKRAARNPYKHGLGGPTLEATLLTVFCIVSVLFIIEYATRKMIDKIVHIDPIFESERNRDILSRHIGVDFLCLFYIASLGITYSSVCHDLIQKGSSFGRSSSMPEEGFADRVFQYHPGSQRILMLFFAYQVKNMFDTIYWNDGPEFVVHHVLAGVAAWGGMFPGCCHFYSPFYMGLSEISTSILCILANFDDEYGVKGLDKVFPRTRLFFAALFVASFIICRVIMWPFVTYYFSKDSLSAIRSNDPRAEGRRGYLWVITYACWGLSLIQIVFLAQIIVVAREEIPKLMS